MTEMKIQNKSNNMLIFKSEACPEWDATFYIEHGGMLGSVDCIQRYLASHYLDGRSIPPDDLVLDYLGKIKLSGKEQWEKWCELSRADGWGMYDEEDL